MYTIYFDMDGTIDDLYGVAEWLTETFPEITFDEMHFVQYGTRKDYVAKDKNGIIFDDDERVRNKWRGEAINPNIEDIIEKLRMIKEMSE